MAKNKLKTREIALAAGLAALSAVVQLIHIGYQSPQFGMWIDIVAVTWIIALFLFGLRISFIVSLIGAIIITLFAPDTWLGASMKWLASFPVWLILGLWTMNKTKTHNYYRSFFHLIIPLFIAIAIRCLIIIPVNYYYAIPLWTGMSSAQAMAAIPWFIIAVFNILQSIVDVVVAWFLVYKFRLIRYTSDY
jgi:riboflavin transporter